MLGLQIVKVICPLDTDSSLCSTRVIDVNILEGLVFPSRFIIHRTVQSDSWAASVLVIGGQEIVEMNHPC